MTVQDDLFLDHDVVSSSLADLRRTAGEVTERRDRICRQVDSLLDGGWRGAAADSFDTGWQDWRSASDRVLDGLVTMTELLAAVHQDLSFADQSSELQLHRVAARLVERLG